MIKRKLMLVAIFVLFSSSVVAFSVSAPQNWEIFSRDLIFYADENIVIKAPTPSDIELLSKGEQTVDMDQFLPEKASKFTIEVNGTDLTFAKDVHGIYNVPLENSPPLYLVNEQSFILVNDHLYKLDVHAQKGIQMTANNYLGKSKSELAQQGYLYWISGLQIDPESESIYYVSNRRSMAEEGLDNQIDLWRINIHTGIEELVVKNGHQFLGSKELAIIASNFKKNNKFDILLIEKGETLKKDETRNLVTDAEMILGRDKYFFYYSKEGFVYKYHIDNESTEKIIDTSLYSFSGVTSSLNLERSFIIATSMKDGHEVLYVTDSRGTNRVDIPRDFTIMGISWINHEEALFSGYLNNNQRNVITYKINLLLGANPKLT